ncbi:fructose-1,6-bisphosphatase/inositol monophosphatase family enzyme [Novosphingobium sp. PhB165]|uniref:inositol monophosphatase family protein n=1 Tax=Novosphingobium sp. PhB165 TaxID=2485105 RepID=UPI0010497C37|nr:inositol monophosphatase family protein [Novosphingobium sp. PhB165]TCM21742.1 fructose-1,6-bisphosphatase/inositol monophosphatase family enzyme [Novosphingobium sp. PhB165]
MITSTLNTAVETIMREVTRDVILPHYQSLSAEQIVSKAVNDVVTVADRESEAILAERLTALLPDAAVVGEEATFANEDELLKLKDRLCWIVDPLDGTNNFASGKAPFGMLIALADKGETLGGWILDCLTGRFCHASAGGGAWVDRERLTARATGEVPPVAAISLIFTEESRRERIRTEVAPHYRLVDIPRCAAEQYPRLALGQNDVAIFERTLPWDHAAGALFLNEAGGMAARPDGSPYRVDEFEKKGLIGASSPALFEGLATRLAALED